MGVRSGFLLLPFLNLRSLLTVPLAGLICSIGLVPPVFAQQLPPVQITSQSLPLGGVNQTYLMQLTATGGIAPYFWRIPGLDGQTTKSPLPPGLALSSDGIISGQPLTPGIYTFPVEVFAANQTTAPARGDLRIIVVRVETESPLPAGQSNVPYSQQLSVTAGNPAWTVIAGQLPGGLALGNTGQLAGTPLAVGTFNFTLRATVQNILTAPAVTADKNFQLVIASGPLGLVTSTLPDGVVGVEYSQLVRAAGGEPPYTITTTDSTLPPGITFRGSQQLFGTPTVAGSFAVQFLVRDNVNATATRTVPLTILPVGGAGSSIQASPLSLSFSAFAGGAPTVPQNVAVTSVTGPPVNFSVTIDSAPAWLSLVNQPGTTPAQLRLRANPGSLAAGTYETRLRLTTTGQTPLTPVEIPVSFVILAPKPQLDVSPRVVQVSTRTVAPRADVVLVLRNTGGGAVVDYGLRVVNASRWIAQVTSAPSRLSPTQPVLIRLSLDAGGLRPGAYRDEIRIETSIGVLRVPVSLFVEELGPALDVSARGLRLPARQGDTPNARRTFQIRNLGGLGTVVNWSAAIVRGLDLFTLSATGGSTATGAPSSLTVGLKPNAADTPGGRSALLRIQDTDPRTQGSPAYVVLVADVAASGAAPRVEFAPTGLLFVGVVGGAPPAAQTLELTTGARSIDFTASTSTNDGANWLRVGSASGTAAAGTPASIGVSIVPGALASGVYTGLVTVGVGAEVRSAGVTLILLPVGARLASADSKSAAVPRMAEGCTPARVALVQTALAESFSVPAGWPATITARLADDCGTLLTNGSVVASFSNGDAPIVLEADGQTGVYTGTWQPGAAAASATVRIEAASGALLPATLEITGGVDVNPAAQPSLVTAGLLNNLNPIVGAPLAPGTVTQVYGDNLTTQPDAPSSVPLPTVYKGVEAIIGGFSAPIYYISKNQLTVQVPSELAANRIHLALLVTEAGNSLPVQLPLVPVQPGTVSFPDGTLVAQHGNYALVTAANPAKPNEVVTVYLVGMGATSPAVASGTAAPGSPLAAVNTNARVTVDGQQAEILFQGLTPGGVGLYQINLRVPASARAGNLDVVITQDGVEANATKLVVGAP